MMTEQEEDKMPSPSARKTEQDASTKVKEITTEAKHGQSNSSSSSSSNSTIPVHKHLAEPLGLEQLRNNSIYITGIYIT